MEMREDVVIRCIYSGFITWSSGLKLSTEYIRYPYLGAIMGKDHLSLRISEETKAEWEEAISESRRYDSMTHLIKLAVDQELDLGRHDSDGTRSEKTGEIDSDELEETLRRVLANEVVPEITDTKLAVIRQREDLQSIRDVLDSQVSYDLEQAVLDVLPRGEYDPHDGGPAHDFGMTEDEVAEVLDSRGIKVENEVVEATLEGLADSMGVVKRREGGDRPDQRDVRYWRAK
jgi:hypothetical protein